jgi:hypothetical protein
MQPVNEAASCARFAGATTDGRIRKVVRWRFFAAPEGRQAAKSLPKQRQFRDAPSLKRDFRAGRIKFRQRATGLSTG